MRDVNILGLGLRLLDHCPDQFVELDDTLCVTSDEVFDLPNNSHVEGLGDVGRVGDEE